MKQSLQLKMGQHLTMTPQLQQAIKLLQLSALDLHLEIQQTLYANPLLSLGSYSDTIQSFHVRPAGNPSAVPTPTAGGHGQ